MLGMGPVIEQVMESNDPHGGHKRVCEGDRARVGVGLGMAVVKIVLLQVVVSFPFPICITQHLL